MVENQDDLVTFEKNPLKYCQQIYEEARKRVEELDSVNKENREFYEGIDPYLEARKNDPNVVRSSINIPILKPAIDTRVADPITKVDLKEHPITLKPADPLVDKGIQERIALLERKLNRQLRDCGYLSNGFKEHIQGAEIYRSPSTVKVGWETTYEKKAVVKQRGFMGISFKPKVVFETVESGHPYVDWMYPEEFLYQPNRSRFEDTHYAGHRMWKTPEELRQMAEDLNYNRKKVEKAIEGAADAQSSTIDNSSQRDRVEEDKGTGFDKGYWDDKVLVVEWYIVIYTDSGQEVVKRVTVVANLHIVKTENSFRGIRLPFVPLTANTLPGTMEGLSSIDIGRPHQRLYNELINSHIDGVSYRMFPPLLRRTGNNFTKLPKLGLGRIWELPDIAPEAIRPLIDNPGQAPDLLASAQLVASNLSDVLSTPDVRKGTQDEPYEKATSTKIRAAASMQRASPTNKQYGLALVAVAKMFIAINQEKAEDGADWVIDMTVDCPTLTNISDPETEKQDWLMALSTALNNPLYMSPLGQRKIRNIMEEVMRRIVKTGIDRYVPTEEEMEQMVIDQTKAQVLMMEKQSLGEQMMIDEGVQNGQTQKGPAGTGSAAGSPTGSQSARK